MLNSAVSAALGSLPLTAVVTDFNIITELDEIWDTGRWGWHQKTFKVKEEVKRTWTNLPETLDINWSWQEDQHLMCFLLWWFICSWNNQLSRTTWVTCVLCLEKHENILLTSLVGPGLDGNEWLSREDEENQERNDSHFFLVQDPEQLLSRQEVSGAWMRLKFSQSSDETLCLVHTLQVATTPDTRSARFLTWLFTPILWREICGGGGHTKSSTQHTNSPNLTSRWWARSVNLIIVEALLEVWLCLQRLTSACLTSGQPDASGITWR